MRITAVRPSWLRAEIPADRAHVSDFGRNDAFNTCLVEIDICQPDPAIAGGITETLRISALAAAHELTVAPHLWGGAVLFATGLHLCVATPCATTVEFSRGLNPLLHDLTEERVELVDGHVLAPTRPGLGLTLRRHVVRAITVPV